MINTTPGEVTLSAGWQAGLNWLVRILQKEFSLREEGEAAFSCVFFLLFRKALLLDGPRSCPGAYRRFLFSYSSEAKVCMNQ